MISSIPGPHPLEAKSTPSVTIIKTSPNDPWVDNDCSEKKQHTFVDRRDLRGSLDTSPEPEALQRPGKGGGLRDLRLGLRWSNSRGQSKRTEADPSEMKGPGGLERGAP